MSNIIQRQDYMSGKVTHEEYYAQFVDDNLMAMVVRVFGKEKLEKAFRADEHFNTLPLRKWDSLARVLNTTEWRRRFQATGDFISLAGCVCTLKQAAKMAIEKDKEQ